MSIDVDTVSDLIRDVGARVIDTRFRALHDHQIHQKKPGDFVTDADRQAEHELGGRSDEVCRRCRRGRGISLRRPDDPCGCSPC